jgi:hypothetical protein
MAHVDLSKRKHKKENRCQAVIHDDGVEIRRTFEEKGSRRGVSSECHVMPHACFGQEKRLRSDNLLLPLD